MCLSELFSIGKAINGELTFMNIICQIIPFPLTITSIKSASICCFVHRQVQAQLILISHTGF